MSNNPKQLQKAGVEVKYKGKFGKILHIIGGIRDMPVEISRRRFLKIGGAVVGGLALAEIGKDAHDLIKSQEVQYPVFSVTIPGLRERLLVVHATDFHVGNNGLDYVNEEVYRQVGYDVACKLQALGAKKENTILAFTGDGVNGRTDDYPIGLFRASMRAFLDEVPAGLLVMVPGNHDINYTGRGDIWQEFNDLGFITLGWDESDRTRIVPAALPIQIVGTPDYTTNKGWYKENRSNLLSEINPGVPVLWLAHNASFVDREGWGMAIECLGTHTLILAGHSHGGQFDSDSLFQYLARLYALGKIEYDSIYVSGRYRSGEHLEIIVSNGIGSSRSYLRTVARQVDFIELLPAL